MSQCNNLPMLRHLPQPLHTRRLHLHIRIKPACHGLMNDRLLLFLQQRYQFLLGIDVPPDAAVDVVEVTDNGGLFGERRKRYLGTAQFFIVDVLALTNASHMQCEIFNEWLGLEQIR